ncbi:MAG: HAMP domain-containing sensor histidine kinase [Clostridiales bacterium]|nr:HAMP domain-containing sensor histidine kinase [Clostridiales bacterium]
MKSNYERDAFRIKYIGFTILFLLVVLVWSYVAFEADWKKIVVILAICLIYSVMMYILAYHMLNHAYDEMENISQRMINVVEGNDKTQEEEYKQGTIGILYTNFYKMVRSLKESKLKEQEEKVFLRDIISDISHQLKTPLASLNVFLDLLVEEKVSDPLKQKQMLEESKNQLSRMEWMVLSMLKLARIEAGAIQFEKKKTNLSTLLLQAAEGIQYLTEERKQKLFVECKENVELICDGDWLIEAVINLLKNASDYSEMGKRIWLEVEENKLYTRIYVKDEGMGIPETELPNIFTRFYRVHQEVNPNSVGIGLALTKSIVEGMGGNITVRSEEGKYTWFIITFVK